MVADNSLSDEQAEEIANQVISRIENANLNYVLALADLRRFCPPGKQAEIDAVIEKHAEVHGAIAAIFGGQ